MGKRKCITVIFMSMEKPFMDMGITVQIDHPIDDTYLSASILGSATVVLQTYTGAGSLTIAIKGNGSKNVNVQYSVDGGAFVTINAANVKSLTTLGFSISLVIQNVNTSGSSSTTSDLSATGLISS